MITRRFAWTGLECHEDASTNPDNASRHNKLYLFIGDRTRCSPTRKQKLIETMKIEKGGDAPKCIELSSLDYMVLGYIYT